MVTLYISELVPTDDYNRNIGNGDHSWWNSNPISNCRKPRGCTDSDW
jgi:hypothetical protein